MDSAGDQSRQQSWTNRPKEGEVPRKEGVAVRGRGGQGSVIPAEEMIDLLFQKKHRAGDMRGVDKMGGRGPPGSRVYNAHWA